MKSCISDEKYTAGVGATTALRAIGPQEKHLYNDSSRFDVRPPRHSHFTKIYKQQELMNVGNAVSWPFGRTIRFTINPHTSGDIITNAYIRLTLPKLATGKRYTAMVGTQLIKNVKLRVDGLVVDDIDIDKWSAIHNELFNSATEKFGLSYLVNNGRNGLTTTWANDNSTDVIPIIANLYLFFSRRRTFIDHPSGLIPGLYLCALYNTQDICIDIEFNDPSWFTDSLDDIGLSTNTLPIDKKLRLVTEEIILTPAEREFYTHSTMNVIYDSISTTTDASFLDDDKHKTNIYCKHPVQSMHWFYRRGIWGSTSSLTAIANRMNFSMDQTVSNVSVHSVAYNVIMQENSVYLNGIHIADNQTPKYYQYIQPYTYNLSIPKRNIYSMSFALRPTSFMPTGSIMIGKQMNKSTLRGNLNGTGFELFLFYVFFNFMQYKDGKMKIT